VMPFGLIKYSSPLTKVAVKVPLPDSSDSVQLKVVAFAAPTRSAKHIGTRAMKPNNLVFTVFPLLEASPADIQIGKANIGEADKHQDCAHKSVKESI
jgi:hypothetical protein